MFEGKKHDLKMIRTNPPLFGKWYRSMKNPKTRKERRITMYVDRGYQGLDKMLPGTRIIKPKKKPKKKKLSKTDKEKNKRISAKRIIIEHIIGKMKFYKLIQRRYEFGPRELKRDLEVISGLVNL